MNKIIVYVMVFVLLSYNVFSLGLAPSQKEFDYKIEMDHKGSIRVISDNYPMNVELSLEGELKNHIIFERNKYEITRDDNYIKYKLNFPELSPGVKTGKILVREIKKKLDANVIASPELIHKIIVSVPYEGKHIKAEIIVTKDELGRSLITVPIKNIGTEKIDKISAKINYIDVYDNDGVLDELNKMQLELFEYSKFSSVFIPKKPGKYISEVIIDYDGKKEILTKELIEGKKEISLIDINVDKFKIGTIAKFDMILENLWNEELEISGVMKITSQNNYKKNIRIEKININPRSKNELSIYWDTKELDIGNYILKFEILSEDLDYIKELEIVVMEEEIIIQGYEKAEKKTNFRTDIIIIIILLILLLILYFNLPNIKKKKFLRGI